MVIAKKYATWMLDMCSDRGCLALCGDCENNVQVGPRADANGTPMLKIIG